jgi:hypothetical protein
MLQHIQQQIIINMAQRQNKTITILFILHWYVQIATTKIIKQQQFIYLFMHKRV